MNLKNILKIKKEKRKEREYDFSNLIIGTTRVGKIEFKNEISDRLVELYRDNRKDEIIKYCNDIYEKIYENSNLDFTCRKYTQDFCNEVILHALQYRKTNTSNVVGIALNILNNDSVQKERIYEELNNMSDNKKIRIINDGRVLLIHLLVIY
ncbi:hypothetical protein K5V21_12690 [Clostridium sardiniense]|uniref:Uncharacterized protein n=1 Tax=Clostridium sardiniense TaxID=29369 RepID=A0ABS7KZR6_CLOSR|nr:hypothetical protein [Clostridium sardiniense]MBY0756305.1 hypothetical protein [Clostridium sardiniense]MDQ0461460.1 hypothetical protein [Clostridium sardiniense]